MLRIVLSTCIALLSITFFSYGAHAAATACEVKNGEVAIKSCSEIITTKTYLGKPISKQNLSIMYENRGRQYFQTEQYQKAISDFENSLRANPKNVKQATTLVRFTSDYRNMT